MTGPYEPLTAVTSWPEAALGIAGVTLLGVVAVVVIWQGMATWRSRIESAGDAAYRELAERTARELRTLNERLDERGSDR